MFPNLFPCVYMKTKIFRFQTRSNTNWPVQSQKQAKSLKFWVQVEVCSKNKSNNQPMVLLMHGVGFLVQRLICLHLSYFTIATL